MRSFTLLDGRRVTVDYYPSKDYFLVLDDNDNEVTDAEIPDDDLQECWGYLRELQREYARDF